MHGQPHLLDSDLQSVRGRQCWEHDGVVWQCTLPAMFNLGYRLDLKQDDVAVLLPNRKLSPTEPSQAAGG